MTRYWKYVGTDHPPPYDESEWALAEIGRERMLRKIRRVKKEPAIITPGCRTELGEFFAKTEVLTERRPHHHFLVFVTGRHSVTVKMVDAARKLDAFDNDCVVLVQWPGQWRSDWFKTTVGEVLSAREEATH